MINTRKIPKTIYLDSLKVSGYPGEYNGMYGKKHSEESKQKNRESNIGKKHSEESKQKIKKPYRIKYVD